MLITREEAEKWLESRKEEPSAETNQFLAEYPDLTGRIQILWHSNYWDGPISGYVMLDGATGFWIDRLEDDYNMRLTIDEPGDDDSCQHCDCQDPCYTWDRLFAVYKLTPEQERIKLSNHALFRKHVGTHTDYGTEAKEKIDHNDPEHPRPIALGRGVLPREGGTYDLFYNAVKPEAPPLTPGQIVGWTCSINPKGWSR